MDDQARRWTLTDKEIRALAIAGAKSGEFALEPLRDGEVQRPHDGSAVVAIAVVIPAEYLYSSLEGRAKLR